MASPSNTSAFSERVLKPLGARVRHRCSSQHPSDPTTADPAGPELHTSLSNKPSRSKKDREEEEEEEEEEGGAGAPVRDRTRRVADCSEDSEGRRGRGRGHR